MIQSREQLRGARRPYDQDLLTIGFPQFVGIGEAMDSFHRNVFFLIFRLCGFKQVLILIPKFGEMIQFDKHIFQMG